MRRFEPASLGYLRRLFCFFAGRTRTVVLTRCKRHCSLLACGTENAESLTRCQRPGDPGCWGESRGWPREAQALSALARQLTPEADERGCCLAGANPQQFPRQFDDPGHSGHPRNGAHHRWSGRRQQHPGTDAGTDHGAGDPSVADRLEVAAPDLQGPDLREDGYGRSRSVRADGTGGGSSRRPPAAALSARPRRARPKRRAPAAGVRPSRSCSYRARSRATWAATRRRR